MENMNVKERMLTSLKQNDTFTVKQAQQRFGIKNVYARISELRQEGYCIYTNPKKMHDGKKTFVYRLGKPNREMVKAALAAGISFGA
jgi:predicted ArsR family transcriptional regulator